MDEQVLTECGLNPDCAIRQIPAYRQFFVALSSQNNQNLLNIASGIVGNELQLLIQPEDLSPLLPASHYKALARFLSDGFNRGLTATLAPLMLVLKSKEYRYEMDCFTESLIKDISLMQMLLTQASQMCFVGSFRELCNCAEAMLKESASDAILVLAQQSAKWIQCDSKEWSYYFDRDLITAVQSFSSSISVDEFLPDLNALTSKIATSIDPKGRSIASALLKSYIRKRLMIYVSKRLYEDCYNLNADDYVEAKMETAMELLKGYDVNEVMMKEWYCVQLPKHLQNDVKKDDGGLMKDEIYEVIQEAYMDTGSPAVLLQYFETAEDVMTAKEIRLSNGGKTRLQCLGKYLKGVNVLMSERVVCQLVLGYVDNELEKQAEEIMHEDERRVQDNQPVIPSPPSTSPSPPFRRFAILGCCAPSPPLYGRPLEPPSPILPPLPPPRSSSVRLPPQFIPLPQQSSVLPLPQQPPTLPQQPPTLPPQQPPTLPQQPPAPLPPQSTFLPPRQPPSLPQPSPAPLPPRQPPAPLPRPSPAPLPQQPPTLPPQQPPALSLPQQSPARPPQQQTGNSLPSPPYSLGLPSVAHRTHGLYATMPPLPQQPPPPPPQHPPVRTCYYPHTPSTPSVPASNHPPIPPVMEHQPTPPIPSVHGDPLPRPVHPSRLPQTPSTPSSPVIQHPFSQSIPQHSPSSPVYTSQYQPQSNQIPTHSNLASMTLQEQLALYSFPEPWKWECMSVVGMDLFASSLNPDHPISQRLIKSLCVTERRIETGTIIVQFVFELNSIFKTLQSMKEKPFTVFSIKPLLISQCKSFFVTFYKLKYSSTEKTLLMLFRNLVKLVSTQQNNALNQLMETCRIAIKVQHTSVEWTSNHVRTLLQLLFGSSEMKLLNETISSFGDVGLLEMIKVAMLPNMYPVT